MLRLQPVRKLYITAIIPVRKRSGLNSIASSPQISDMRPMEYTSKFTMDPLTGQGKKMKQDKDDGW